MRVPLWRHLVVCVFEFFADSHLPNEVVATERLKKVKRLSTEKVALFIPKGSILEGYLSL